MATLCVFLQNSFFFSLEKWAFQLNDRANADPISAVVMRNVPRLIPTLRENFQFVFRALQDEEWPSPNFPEEIP